MEWYTRTTQNRVGQPLRVRVSPRPPCYNHSMKKISWLILLVIIATLTVLAVTNHKTPSNNSTNDQNQVQVEDKWTALAKALTAKGAKMYGASWCTHCQEQKTMFGTAFQYVTYIECADAKDPNKQIQACIDAKIGGYPTWVFADGSHESGALTYEQLSQKIS